MRVLSLGAGVQSTTVLLLSLRGELPPIDHAIFADTGYEPSTTHECVARLQDECAKHGVPLHIVAIDGEQAKRDFKDQIPAFVLSPDGSRGITRRQCTRDYKINPIRKKIRELLGLAPRQRIPKDSKVTQVFGIGWDETHRMKVPDDDWMVYEYPLVDRRWGRRECLEWLSQNWPYKVARSACWNCPYRSISEWRNLHDTDYQSFVKAIVFDAELRVNPPRGLNGTAFLHRSMKPLSEVDIRSDEEKGQPSLFGNECEGMCGV